MALYPAEFRCVVEEVRPGVFGISQLLHRDEARGYLLEAGIAVPAEELVHTAEAAVRAVEAVAPAVLKVVSAQLSVTAAATDEAVTLTARQIDSAVARIPIVITDRSGP